MGKSWANAGDFQKLDYIKQMLEVVRHINEKGYVWRDVKPTNFVFFDDRLKGIDFDISLPKGTRIQDSQSTSLYTPPEIAQLFVSNFSSTMYINETYDSWSMGMVILELLRNEHYILTERINNHPHCASSESHNDVLQRVAHESFLGDVDEFIESHYKHKSFSYPIFKSLLCESSKRQSAKDILKMRCFKFDGTYHTQDFTQLKETIKEEMRHSTLSQFTDFKSMILQIQSSIPTTKAELKNYISTESLLMNRVKNESCKAQLTNLQTTLLEQLDSQQHDLKDIIADLEDGFLSIQDGIEDVENKLDSTTSLKL